jgi:hypothetical protein
VALTPVFLLSGIATLLNVFSTRLARVADRVDAVAKALEGADPDQVRALTAQLVHLHRSTVKRTPDDMRHMACKLDNEARRRTRRARLRARLSAYRDTALLLTSPFGRIYRRLKT